MAIRSTIFMIHGMRAGPWAWGLFMPFRAERGYRCVARAPSCHDARGRLTAGLLMDLLNPAWRALNSAGCNLNRNVGAAVSSAGFTLVEVKSFRLFTDTFQAGYPYRYIRAVRT